MTMNRATSNGSITRRPHRRPKTIALVLAVIAIAVMIVLPYGSEMEISPVDATMPNETAAQDFSRFRHDTQQHRRMPCLVCHVRSDKSPTMKMPGHIPCSSCHTQQFAEGNSSPICTICHTPTDVKRFPPLRSFNAVFDHGRHTRQTNCATCHKPRQRGVALSIPSRASAHVTCFQCHGPQTLSGGKNIGSCSTCHQLGRLVRTPETALAFARNFSHSEHARKGLSCSECHAVRTGARRGAQVSAPVASMHFAPSGIKSCASCHDNRRAFGGTDFMDCKKCHERNSFKF
jgi:c(7)-type cytochrome triheme protein